MARQAIFVHVPKTAGTSICKALKGSGETYQDLGYSLYPKCDPRVTFTTTSHLSVKGLIERGVFTQDWYDSCFKFAFVRNPWDRLVSLFEYLQYRLNQTRQRESNQYLHSFEAFARKVTEKDCSYVKPLGRTPTDDWSQANPQVRWLESSMSLIGRYEHLQVDWDLACHLVGLPLTDLTAERKSKKRFGTYDQYYTPEIRDMVEEFYKKDIERFNYKFITLE